LFQLTGCFERSVYKEEKSSERFAPREYYRNHLSFNDTGAYSTASLVDKMKQEILKENYVKHAIVIKQKNKYIVAIQMNAYHYEKAKNISIRYKKHWEDKWKVPVEVMYTPIDFRRAEKMTKNRKRA
jgi:hypothetical protein